MSSFSFLFFFFMNFFSFHELFPFTNFFHFHEFFPPSWIFPLSRIFSSFMNFFKLSWISSTFINFFIFHDFFNFFHLFFFLVDFFRLGVIHCLIRCKSNEDGLNRIKDMFKSRKSQFFFRFFSFISLFISFQCYCSSLHSFSPCWIIFLFFIFFSLFSLVSLFPFYFFSISFLFYLFYDPSWENRIKTNKSDLSEPLFGMNENLIFLISIFFCFYLVPLFLFPFPYSRFLPCFFSLFLFLLSWIWSFLGKQNKNI